MTSSVSQFHPRMRKITSIKKYLYDTIDFSRFWLLTKLAIAITIYMGLIVLVGTVCS